MHFGAATPSLLDNHNDDILTGIVLQLFCLDCDVVVQAQFEAAHQTQRTGVAPPKHGTATEYRTSSTSMPLHQELYLFWLYSEVLIAPAPLTRLALSDLACVIP